jgi:hypothetical protein
VTEAETILYDIEAKAETIRLMRLRGMSPEQAMVTAAVIVLDRRKAPRTPCPWKPVIVDGNGGQS